MTHRIVFMGTPDFAIPSFNAIREAGAMCVGVWTQPPRPKGRGHQVQDSPVALAAHDVPVMTPISFKQNPETIDILRDLAPDLILVAAYGLLLPQAVLDIPRLGCVNVHASLLPRWRGASPIQSALRAGDQKTGITLMRMDIGLDTGDMIAQEALPITPDMNSETLQAQLAVLGGAMVRRFLENPETILADAVPQPNVGVTYAPKIMREDGLLDFNLSARELQHWVQAYTPFPGAWCWLGEKRLKILKAHVGADVVASQGVTPGMILNEGFQIAAGAGVLVPEILQLEGKGPMTPADFMRGHSGLEGILLVGRSQG